MWRGVHTVDQHNRRCDAQAHLMSYSRTTPVLWSGTNNRWSWTGENATLVHRTYARSMLMKSTTTGSGASSRVYPPGVAPTMTSPMDADARTHNTLSTGPRW